MMTAKKGWRWRKKTKVRHGAPSWRPSRCLATLLAQVKATAPKDRDTQLDAFKGDAAHAARRSDHNPDSKGIVRALDVTKDLSAGVDTFAMLDHFRVRKELRVRFCIANGKIFGNEEFCRSNPKLKMTPWQWHRYTGPNGHHMHGHVSTVRDDRVADDTSPWPLVLKAPTAPPGDKVEPMPTLRRGSKGVAVQLLQGKLKIDIDGHFGPRTEKAVKEFQKKKGIAADGIVGPYTWKALLGA